jgi:hypothetical protein
MSTVDAATFKAYADQFLAKALDGDVTIIDQDGKRAILMKCEGVPDVELFPNTDNLLTRRVATEGREPSETDWEALSRSISKQ